MRRAISPRFATSSLRTGAMCSVSSEPEDAEAVVPADLVAMRRRQRDAQHGPRVAGIDDAIVGDTARRVERARFALGALLHRGGQPRILLLVEGPARCAGAAPPHDRHDASELLRAHD